MDLAALNNLQGLICHKTQQTKPIILCQRTLISFIDYLTTVTRYICYQLQYKKTLRRKMRIIYREIVCISDIAEVKDKLILLSSLMSGN